MHKISNPIARHVCRHRRRKAVRRSNGRNHSPGRIIAVGRGDDRGHIAVGGNRRLRLVAPIHRAVAIEIAGDGPDVTVGTGRGRNVRQKRSVGAAVLHRSRARTITGNNGDVGNDIIIGAVAIDIVAGRLRQTVGARLHQQLPQHGAGRAQRLRRGGRRTIGIRHKDLALIRLTIAVLIDGCRDSKMIGARHRRRAVNDRAVRVKVRHHARANSGRIHGGDISLRAVVGAVAVIVELGRDAIAIDARGHQILEGQAAIGIVGLDGVRLRLIGIGDDRRLDNIAVGIAGENRVADRPG